MALTPIPIASTSLRESPDLASCKSRTKRVAIDFRQFLKTKGGVPAMTEPGGKTIPGVILRAANAAVCAHAHLYPVHLAIYDFKYHHFTSLCFSFRFSNWRVLLRGLRLPTQNTHWWVRSPCALKVNHNLLTARRAVAYEIDGLAHPAQAHATEAPINQFDRLSDLSPSVGVVAPMVLRSPKYSPPPTEETDSHATGLQPVHAPRLTFRLPAQARPALSCQSTRRRRATAQNESRS